MADVMGRKTGGRVKRVLDWDSLPPVKVRVQDYLKPFNHEVLSAGRLSFDDGVSSPVYRWGEVYVFVGDGASYRWKEVKQSKRPWRIWSSSNVDQLATFNQVLKDGGARRFIAVEDIGDCAEELPGFYKALSAWAVGKKKMPLMVLLRKSHMSEDFNALKQLCTAIHKCALEHRELF